MSVTAASIGLNAAAVARTRLAGHTARWAVAGLVAMLVLVATLVVMAAAAWAGPDMGF